MTKMICKVCGKEADWDTSYGRPCFIVCGSCFYKIIKNTGFDERHAVLDTILNIGWIMEEEEEKKNG